MTTQWSLTEWYSCHFKIFDFDLQLQHPYTVPLDSLAPKFISLIVIIIIYSMSQVLTFHPV